MLPVDVITARLVAALPALAGRVGTTLQLSEAMRTSTLGQVDFSAYLLTLALRGGAASASTGVFSQRLDRMLSVLLVRRAIGDPLGEQVTDAFAVDIEAAICAIAGWAPDEAIGVFQLDRGELVSVAGGVATFQLDFSLNDQLRIFE
jgi:hypothetical protein